MTTPDEASTVDTYRTTINNARPADPVVDPKDPSIKARLAFPTELARPQPPYPSTLRRDRVQGRALLAGVIERDGSVSNVTVLTSTGNAELDEGCLDTLRKWRYKPALLDGQPVRLVVTTVFTFSVP
ncbi:MAG: energy transducer TonB [Acidobacteria bacterium]|nr:energy transducer TonB [Acidobacteriota bacterium]